MLNFFSCVRTRNTQFLQNLLLSAFAKVDTNGNKVIDTNELAVLFAIMAHDKSKDDTPELMQLLKVRIESELGAGSGADGEDRKTDFDRFADFSLDLLAASVLCALKDDAKAASTLAVRHLLFGAVLMCVLPACATRNCRCLSAIC
jgi:hypothetical protein